MLDINWIAYRMLPYDGYGRYSRYLIRALTMGGVGVHPGLVTQLTDMPGWMLPLAGFDFTNITIQCMPAHEFRPVTGRVWGLTMTEDDGIPADWPDTINRMCERLIVPCEHNAEVMVRRGVKVPVHVVYGGTEPGEFPIRPWVNDGSRPYTFLAMGDRPPRKGLEEAYAAFYQAFPDERDVRLIIKVRPEFLPWWQSFQMTDHRVTLWRGNADSLADLFIHTDCFIFPSYGEGWGMPPREAAMMGLPVIATRWSGLEVGLDNWAIPLEKITLTESLLQHGKAQWAKPDVTEVAEKMRWCFDNRQAAAEIGHKAAAWLRENQTWQHSATSLKGLLEKYG